MSVHLCACSSHHAHPRPHLCACPTQTCILMVTYVRIIMHAWLHIKPPSLAHVYARLPTRSISFAPVCTYACMAPHTMHHLCLQIGIMLCHTSIATPKRCFTLMDMLGCIQTHTLGMLGTRPCHACHVRTVCTGGVGTTTLKSLFLAIFNLIGSNIQIPKKS